MRIDRLDLRAYGPFTGTTLDLSGGDRGLHVIHGPNEAGKSTALRALRGLLFGVPLRCEDAHLHAYNALRIGAVLRDERGETLEIVRRKANARSLRGGDDEAEVDPATLENQFLGGIPEKDFLTRFAIDHASLSSGGAEAMKVGGELALILFGSGLDLAELRAYQKRLEAEMDSLFKPSGQNPRINQAIKALDEARKEIDAASLKGADWSDLTAELADLRTRRQAVDRDWRRASAERERLHRARRALPDLARREVLQVELEGLAGAPILAADFPERRRGAEERIIAASADRTASATERGRLTAALDALPSPPPILDQAGAIEAIHQEIGEEKERVKARAKLSRKLAEQQKSALAWMRELGLADDPMPAPPPRPRPGLKARIQKLKEDQTASQFDRDAARRDIESFSKAIAELDRTLADLPPPVEAGGLRRALARAQALGDSSEPRDQAARELARREKQVKAALARLGDLPGDAEEVARLPVPATEILASFRDEIEAAESTLAAARREYDQVEDHLLNLVQVIERQVRESDVPDEADLDTRRASRDAAWGRLKAALRDAPAADMLDLAESFEAASRAADDVADRLRRSAAEVATMARNRADKAHLAEVLNAKRRRREDAAEALAAILARWSALWTPLGIAAQLPREMIPWAAHHAALVEKMEQADEARERLAAIDSSRSSAVADLHGELLALGETVVARESLALARARADAALARCDELAARRADATRSRRQAEQDREESVARLGEEEGNAAVLRLSWAKAVEPLGLGPDASPDEAVAVLDATTELSKCLDEVSKIASEVSDSASASGDFAARLSDLAETYAGGASDGPPERAAEALLRSLNAAREVESTRRTLAGSLEAAEDAIRRADSALDRSRLVLEALAREAGTESTAELAAIERLALDRADRDRELRAIEERLAALAPGTSPDALAVEARLIPRDDLDANLARLDEEYAALIEEQQRLSKLEGEKGQQLRALEDTAREARAEAAASQREHLLAVLETDVERYVHLRLALAVLRGAIEEFREKNQAPVLRRAGEHFARLTLGSFSGLRADLNDKDEPILQGVRPGDASPLDVAGMSEASAKQLYLAMKLASLEHHLETRTPLPLIVDDLLIHFDDDRAGAALECLAELSKRTQVLFFTHHEHLVGLARSRLPANTVFVHRLPGRAV